jgi:hypothetical protein
LIPGTGQQSAADTPAGPCKFAKRYNRQEILGETSAANAFSLINAMQAGAYVVSAGRDPEDGCQLLNFRFSHTHQPQLTQKPATILSLATQFNQISRLLPPAKWWELA